MGYPSLLSAAPQTNLQWTESQYVWKQTIKCVQVTSRSQFRRWRNWVARSRHCIRWNYTSLTGASVQQHGAWTKGLWCFHAMSLTCTEFRTWAYRKLDRRDIKTELRKHIILGLNSIYLNLILAPVYMLRNTSPLQNLSRTRQSSLVSVFTSQLLQQLVGFN
jgi:hypothetical protein